jgi:hypothetical protein
MNTANLIIDRFGGQTKLAKLLGKTQSVVNYWAKKGTIPAKWHSPLLKLAEEKGIVLSASDFASPQPVVLVLEQDPDSESEVLPAEIYKTLPTAEHRGALSLMEASIPCYVLSNGQRVIGRTSLTEMLTSIKGGGALEKYIGVESLKPFIPIELVLERMVSFRLPEVEGLGKAVKGLPADAVIDICKGFMTALEQTSKLGYAGVKLTARQVEMAIKAGMFVAACAKVGLDALIDEATGFQYARPVDALQVKLAAYLEKEMRAWERTFPEELWKEFGRLTGWSHSVTKRPKYWGKLVMELIYENLDKDVAEWLKKNAPAPRHGQNYHQWLTGQYGLKKLIEHIWLVVGVAKTCRNLRELKEKLAEMFGKVAVQYTFYLPIQTSNPSPQSKNKT